MDVCLDARMINHSGIGRYVRNLIVNMPLTYRFLLGDASVINRAFEMMECKKEFEIMECNLPIYSVREQLAGSFFLSKLYQNVIHIPHYNVPVFVPDKTIVTIHDLTHFLFPQYYNKIQVALGWFILKRAVRQSKRIIAVSRSTANDIIRFCPGSEEKIRVVHQGVDNFFKPAPQDEVEVFKMVNGLGKYILHVGSSKPHKNFDILLKAFSYLRKKYDDITLVAIGRYEDIKLEGVTVLSDVTDRELRFLYCGAIAMVFPSLYEGFGFPPLEAMACGTPVAVSSAGSIPEVAGQAALYFNPEDVKEIIDSIEQLISRPELCLKLRDQGFKRMALFSWEKTCRETMGIYLEVAGETHCN